MVNGLGSAGETAPAGPAVMPAGAAAVPEQPAARRARPAAAAATARRMVLASMVPPVCRNSPRTVRPRDASGIGAAPRAGLWPARIFPAAAVPQSGHGTRGAVRGHPGTPGRAGPFGRSGAGSPAHTVSAVPAAELPAYAAGPGRSTTYAGSSAAGTALTVCAGL